MPKVFPGLTKESDVGKVGGYQENANRHDDLVNPSTLQLTTGEEICAIYF